MKDCRGFKLKICLKLNVCLFCTAGRQVMEIEVILKLSEKLTIVESLLKSCKIQLLNKKNIEEFIKKDDWIVSLKIDIEYDLAYEKL